MSPLDHRRPVGPAADMTCTHCGALPGHEAWCDLSEAPREPVRRALELAGAAPEDA